jgi:hypothetical protein
MSEIARAATCCRFQTRSVNDDEVVLQSILRLLGACMNTTAAQRFDPALIFQLYHTCVRMCMQPRLSRTCVECT